MTQFNSVLVNGRPMILAAAVILSLRDLGSSTGASLCKTSPWGINVKVKVRGSTFGRGLGGRGGLGGALDRIRFAERRWEVEATSKQGWRSSSSSESLLSGVEGPSPSASGPGVDVEVVETATTKAPATL
jgi:hypothetical protein